MSEKVKDSALGSHRFIKDLKPNQTISGIYQIIDISIKKTKTGKDYISGSLRDKSGQLAFKVWDILSIDNEVLSADFINLKGSTQEYQGQIQISATEIYKVEVKEDDIHYFVDKVENLRELVDELREIISSLEDKNLKRIIIAVFKDTEVFNKYIHSPGATGMHHAKIGGLLEHSLGIVRSALNIVKQYPLINRDLLLVGSLLHDIGKIFELSYYPKMTYTDEGKLLGHIILGCNYLNSVIDKMGDIPEVLKNKLLHIIISHHGKLEYGSPKVPIILEAVIINYLDELDAKINNFSSEIENKGDESWSTFNRMFNSSLFLG